MGVRHSTNVSPVTGWLYLELWDIIYICTGDVGVRLLLLLCSSGRVIIRSGTMKLSCGTVGSTVWYGSRIVSIVMLERTNKLAVRIFS